MKNQNQYLKKKLDERLQTFMGHLDAEAQEAIFDLAARLHPLERMEKPPMTDLCISNEIGFMAKHGGVLFGNFPESLSPLLVKDLEELNTKRFATFAENRMYCEGTEGLLEILTRYHNLKTESATISAVPDACVRVDGQAVFRREDADVYGNERTVYVSVVFECGFMMFAFEENVGGQPKVRPQKVFRR